MSNIETNARSSFFPHNKPKVGGAGKTNTNIIVNDQSTPIQKNEKKPINLDSKVDIDETIKDFSKIKLAVDKAPPIDNSAKIASLKQQINAGTYKMDYDQLADSILQSEF
jgi:negative regulator of flagellin synthesis FlgM